MLTLLELHAAAGGVDKLPIQEMEDQSLIFPTVIVKFALVPIYHIPPSGGFVV
jgi:hypothetical protein